MADKNTISEVMREFAKMGGEARARKLTKEERSASAIKAAQARWKAKPKKAAKAKR